MTNGTVLEIWTAPEGGAPMVAHEQVDVLRDHGIKGDRYAEGAGSYIKPGYHPDRQITLIEQEQFDWLQAEHGVSLSGEGARRNIVTQGVGLNELIGRRILIGNVELEGIRLCQPCKPLADILEFDFVNLMLNRSGLNCKVLTSGTIQAGDDIEVLPASA